MAELLAFQEVDITPALATVAIACRDVIVPTTKKESVVADLVSGTYSAEGVKHMVEPSWLHMTDMVSELLGEHSCSKPTVVVAVDGNVEGPVDDSRMDCDEGGMAIAERERMVFHAVFGHTWPHHSESMKGRVPDSFSVQAR